MTPPEIKGFLETSFVDWPGQVASVVFLPGCNFRCPYCHNHALVTDPVRLGSWGLDAVLARLEAFRGWVDGVVVTGGEPTLHAGLAALCATFRDGGWAVKLDTNGSRPDVLAALVREGLLAAAAVDVKAPLEPVPYRRNAGRGAEPDAVAESLSLLAASALPVEVRTTIHPHLLSREEVGRLARQAGKLLRSGRGRYRFTPQRCRVEETLDPALRERAPLEPDDFEGWAAEARGVFHRALGESGS